MPTHTAERHEERERRKSSAHELAQKVAEAAAPQPTPRSRADAAHHVDPGAPDIFKSEHVRTRPTFASVQRFAQRTAPDQIAPIALQPLQPAQTPPKRHGMPQWKLMALESASSERVGAGGRVSPPPPLPSYAATSPGGASQPGGCHAILASEHEGGGPLHAADAQLLASLEEYCLARLSATVHLSTLNASEHAQLHTKARIAHHIA